MGEGIAKKIDEYLRTGKLEFMEKLEKKVPEGAVELMQVPGIGPQDGVQALEGLRGQDVAAAEGGAGLRRS